MYKYIYQNEKSIMYQYIYQNEKCLIGGKALCGEFDKTKSTSARRIRSDMRTENN